MECGKKRLALGLLGLSALLLLCGASTADNKYLQEKWEDRTIANHAVMPGMRVHIADYIVKDLTTVNGRIYELWVTVIGSHKFHPLVDLAGMNHHLRFPNGEAFNGIVFGEQHENLIGNAARLIPEPVEAYSGARTTVPNNPESYRATMWDEVVSFRLRFMYPLRIIKDNAPVTYNMVLTTSSYLQHRDSFRVRVFKGGVKVLARDPNDQLVVSNGADFVCRNCPNSGFPETEPEWEPCYPSWACLRLSDNDNHLSGLCRDQEFSGRFGARLLRFDPERDGFGVYYWPEPDRPESLQNAWYWKDSIWLAHINQNVYVNGVWHDRRACWNGYLWSGPLGSDVPEWMNAVGPGVNDPPLDQGLYISEDMEKNLHSTNPYFHGYLQRPNSPYPSMNVLAFYDNNGNGKFDIHVDDISKYYMENEAYPLSAEANDENIYYIGPLPESILGPDILGSMNYSDSTELDTFKGPGQNLRCESFVWDMRPFYTNLPGEIFDTMEYFPFSRPKEYQRIRPDIGPGAWEAYYSNWPQSELLSMEDRHAILGIDMAGTVSAGAIRCFLGRVTVTFWDAGRDRAFDPVRMLDSPVNNPNFYPFSGIWLYRDGNSEGGGKNFWFDKDFDTPIMVTDGPDPWRDANNRTDLFEEGGTVGPWRITMRTYRDTGGGTSQLDPMAFLNETASQAPTSMGHPFPNWYEPTPDFFVVVRPDSGFADSSPFPKDGFGAMFGSNFRAYIEPGGIQWGYTSCPFNFYCPPRGIDTNLLWEDTVSHGPYSTSMILIDADGDNHRGNTLLIGAVCSHPDEYDVKYLHEYGDEPGYMAMPDLDYPAMTIPQWLKAGQFGFWDLLIYPSGAQETLEPGTELTLFTSEDNVYWYDTEPLGVWNGPVTYDTNNADGLWIDVLEDGLYDPGAGDIALVQGKLQAPSVYECRGRELSEKDGFAYYDANGNGRFDIGEMIFYTHQPGDKTYRSRMRRFFAHDDPGGAFFNDRVYFVDDYQLESELAWDEYVLKTPDFRYTPWVDDLFLDVNGNERYDPGVDRLIVSWPLGSQPGDGLRAQGYSESEIHSHTFPVGLLHRPANVGASWTSDWDMDGVSGEINEMGWILDENGEVIQYLLNGLALELAYYDANGNKRYDIGEDIFWDVHAYDWYPFMEQPAYFKHWPSSSVVPRTFEPNPRTSWSHLLPEAAWHDPNVKLSWIGLELHDYVKRPGILRQSRALPKPKIGVSDFAMGNIAFDVPIPVAGINLCSSPDPVTQQQAPEFLQAVRVDFMPRIAPGGSANDKESFKPNLSTDTPNNPASGHSDLAPLANGVVSFTMAGETYTTSLSGVSLFKDNKQEGAKGVFDLPADQAVPLQAMEWKWDAAKGNWYVILRPSSPQEVYPNDYAFVWKDGAQTGNIYRDLEMGPYAGDDYFVCIIPCKDLTYENEIQVRILDNDGNPQTVNWGVQLAHGENAQGSGLLTDPLTANMNAQVISLMPSGDTVDANSGPKAVFGLNMRNDHSHRTNVWFEYMVVEMYDEDRDGRFNPATDLAPFTFTKTGDRNDIAFSGLALYADTNRNGRFDPPVVQYSTDGSCTIVGITYPDEPVILDYAPTFIGAPGEPIQVELSFKDPTRRQVIPPNDSGEFAGPDFFVVFATSHDIDDGDDFRFGIVGMGPEGEAWGYRALGFVEERSDGSSHSVYRTRTYPSSVSGVIVCSRSGGSGPPPAPTLISIDTMDTCNTVRLCWTVPTPDAFGSPTNPPDLAGYNIYRATSGAFQLVASVPYNPVQVGGYWIQCMTDTSVTNGILYRYVVRAVDNERCPGPYESQNSNELSITPKCPEPSCPVPNAVAYNGNIVVSWTQSPELDVVGYNVYRRTSGGAYNFNNPLNGATLIPRTTTQYTDRNVVDGTQYCYTVIAVNDKGYKSKDCGEVCVTALDAAPSPPQLSGVDGLDGHTILNWQPPQNDDLAGYNLYRRDPAGTYNYGNPINGTMIPKTVLTYTDSNLVNDQTYCYVARSVDTSGKESVNSNEVCLTPIADPPDPPILRVDEVTRTYVKLSWTMEVWPSDLAGFRLYRSTLSGLFAGPLVNLTKSVRTYSDSAVVAGTTYYYVITAVDTNGNESLRSNQVKATPKLKPDAPRTLVAHPLDAMVLLSWARNEESNILGYEAFQAIPSWQQLPGSNVILSATRYLHWGPPNGRGLTSNILYGYQVRAVDRSMNYSNLSSRADVLLGAKAPAAPIPVASPGDTSILVQWKDARPPDVLKYILSRSKMPDTGYSAIATVNDTGYGLFNGVTYSYWDSSVPDNATYYYRLRAEDKDGLRGPISPWTSARVDPSLAPPNAPLNLRATPGDTMVRLDWTANLEADLSHYAAYMAQTELGPWNQVANNVPLNTCEVGGLTNGITYYFYVTAWDIYGNESMPSNIAAATPQQGLCFVSPPKKLKSVTDDTWIFLNWSPSTDPTVTAYRVYRIYPYFDVSYQLMATVPATQTWYLEDPLTQPTWHAGNKVCYYVTAVGTCESGPSNLLCGTGRPRGGWGL